MAVTDEVAMWLLGGIALVAWGVLKIVGVRSPLVPWPSVGLGVLVIAAAGSPFVPHRRPGESSRFIEERHYIGPRDSRDHEQRC